MIKRICYLIQFYLLFFFALVFIAYWLIPCKYQWLLLLISSYYFYMNWNVKYVFLILLTTVVSYVAGLVLERESKVRYKKVVTGITIGISMGGLFVFKYFNFFSKTVASIINLTPFKANPIVIHLMLPVGISFYTFQSLSYVIDVYKGRVSAEHHFGHYATFISFFPQLVAGPIERTEHLLPQIKALHKFNYGKVTYGIKLMAWGYFKKMIIADNLSHYVSTVFDDPTHFTGFSLVLSTIFFAIQIYCDFSGYSDIAIGCAKMMGIDLMANFKSPYYSQSVKEFWTRWHISLSTWFKDYVYIPLGGNRVSKPRHSANLLITFLASGLWHGANWTFVAWGGVTD